MSHEIHGLPRAKIERSYLTGALWLIPAIAAAFCAYFVIHDVFLSGPKVTIYFQDAQGLQEKNSVVRYRGIKVGDVESVKLAKDGKMVAVTAKIDRSASELARQGSIFWIVHPQFKVGEISGLRTIVAGNYVAVQPGDGPETNEFIGAEAAPVAPVPSTKIELLTSDLGSLQEQSPIYYHGVQVGEVTDFHFSDDARFVVVEARIRQDYAALVRTNSEFWNAGGLHVHAGLFSGLQISAESAKTLIGGGIAFATPDNYGPPATNDSVFLLNEKEDEDWKSWDPTIKLSGTPGASGAGNLMSQINSQ